MRAIKRWRYYCDYCNKSGGSKWHMEKHESRCTNNPNRKCGLCEMDGRTPKNGEELQDFMSQFIVSETIGFNGELYDENKFKVLEWEKSTGPRSFEDKLRIQKEKEEEVIKNLREFVNGCPACMLAAMRLSKITSLFPSFNGKKERDAYYRDILNSY